MIEDLLIEFDEMGFAPTTLCENPEKYAVEWKKRLVAEIDKLQTALFSNNIQIAQEVVRCKDCKHFYNGNFKACRHWNYHSVTETDFCSYGKRKGKRRCRDTLM